MPDRTYLGLDLGTSSLKAVLVDDHGREHEQANVPYPLERPREGHAEIDPESWWSATLTAVGALRGRATVAAIGLSGQMHGVVLADAKGRATRPAVLWPDTRAGGELERYAALPAVVRGRLANPLVAGMAGPILCWLQGNEPTSVSAARWALQPKDWLRLRLTGNAAGDPSDASATLLYDLVADGWDTELCDLLGLDAALLPPLSASGALAGGLTSTAAEALGLRAGIPVATGAADTAAAAFGTGLHEPGSVQLTVGTGGQLVAPLTTPRAAPASGTHLYRAATSHGWYSMAATLNAGLALDWVCQVTAATWDELYAATGTHVDDPYFLPHLAGERTPYLDASMRGSWTGLSLQHDRPALLRAALEGVVYAIRDAFDALPGPAAEAVRLAGGGSRHAGFRQLLADVLERPLLAVDAPAASARGAALLGAIALGTLTEDDVAGMLAPTLTRVAEPSPDRTALHRERRRRFADLVAARRRE